MSDVTRVLQSIAAGDQTAQDQLLALVYEELRAMAAAKMAREQPGQTLQATALVHEAWVKLVGNGVGQSWQNRGHFFGAAAEAMRRILVDRARKKASLRHGGGLERVDLDQVHLATEDSDEAVLAMNEALEKLVMVSPEKAEVVKLRYFTGLEMQEIADTMDVSLATIERHWAYARAWLLREMTKISKNC